MQNKIPYIIGASTIGLLSLILIQVKWMQQSRNLIEEQFDQKVSMALCQAVETIAGECIRPATVTVCGTPQQLLLPQAGSFSPRQEDVIPFHAAVQQALIKYQIDLPFELDLRNESASLLPKTELGERIYSCSLDPSDELENGALSIRFPDKQAYVLSKMSLMLTLSIIILLFITGVFIYANYYLLRQKLLSERNQEFFNHMAHEFKTPLTNIGLAAKLLRKKSDSHLLEIINAESQQLDAQVNRVLSMASLEAGHYEMNLEKVAVRKWIENLVAAMSIQLNSQGATVEIIGGKDDLWIAADRFHLANAIRNILENALKYCDTQARVLIRIEEFSAKVRISIQDNGIGISPDKQQRVFDKFYRIEQGNVPGSKGFGLGLSYVKKIVELHGGALEVKSQERIGSSFDLLIPKTTAYA